MATLNVFERAIGAPKRIAARRLRPGRAIRRLSQGPPRAREIARALQVATGEPASPDDEERMSKIEQIRSELAVSDETVEQLGYGKDGGRSGSSRPSAVSGLSRASTEEPWCRLLYMLVRSLHPQSCLELGTSLGISAAYVASALDANEGGRLITIEGSPGVADRARQNLEVLGLDRGEVRTGRFQDVLDEVLEGARPVDLAYIDGHHDERATLDYFSRIAAEASSEAVMLFDDISWSRGMDRAWKAIDGDERCGVTANLGDVGLCSLEPSNAVPVG